MKTNYSDMAKRYEMAEQMVWAKLENWQKIAITQDRKEGKTSNVFDTFAKQVIALAESLTFAPKGEMPPKSSKSTLTPARN